jgi:uncharacterized phage-associated protein
MDIITKECSGEMTMLTADEVADYFLDRANDPNDDGDLISNLKLQKLLYYAQGLHLALHGESLFPEALCAWQHGPVVPSVWRKYNAYGSSALPRPEAFQPDRYDERTRETLDEVYEVFGQFSAWKLREMTHEERPWQETPINEEISQDLLRDYFRTRLIHA